MLFSILIPVYNADRYLKQCLESIVAQTYRDFEVWMINDGSKDNSGEICNEYARKYPHMHVVHRENRGTIITRAELVSYAQGDYCLFVDSDDYIRRDTLDVVKTVLLKTNADCVVFGLERVLNGCSIGVTAEESAFEMKSKDEIYSKLLGDVRYNSLCTKCIRTCKLKGFDAVPYRHFRMGEDLIQGLHAYKQMEKIAFIPDILYYYVMNPDSTSHTTNQESFRACCDLYNAVMDTLGDEVDKNSTVAEAIRSNYAWYLTLDILCVERFELPKSEKLNILREIAHNSKDILDGAVRKEKIGKRYPLYLLMKLGYLRSCLALAWLVNKKNHVHRRKDD